MRAISSDRLPGGGQRGFASPRKGDAISVSGKAANGYPIWTLQQGAGPLHPHNILILEVVMEFLIAGLLVLNLAVTLVSVHLLRRETERVFRDVGQLLGEAKASLTGVNASQTELMHKLVRMDEQRKKGTEELRKEFFAQLDGCLSYGAETVKSLGTLWNESERQTAVLQSLLAREDASESLKKLQAMLEESPSVLSRDQEGAMSKAMEEGISSILGYTAGKAPGVEFRL